MVALFWLWLGIARLLDLFVALALDAREAWLRMQVFRELRRARAARRVE